MLYQIFVSSPMFICPCSCALVSFFFCQLPGLPLVNFRPDHFFCSCPVPCHCFMNSVTMLPVPRRMCCSDSDPVEPTFVSYLPVAVVRPLSVPLFPSTSPPISCKSTAQIPVQSSKIPCTNVSAPFRMFLLIPQ